MMILSPPPALLADKTLTRITLVRHGETFQNREKVVQGQSPTWGRLTPEGVEQARVLGDALKERDFDRVYCSPLERAVLTMSLMLVPRGGNRTLPLVFADDLKEIHQGVLHGASHEQWKAAMDGHDPMAFRSEGGESWLDVQARVTRYLRETVLPAPGESILIVAHGGVNRGMLASLTGMSMGDAWRGAGVGCPQDNTCVNDLLVDGAGNLRWALVNDTSHLRNALGRGGAGQLWLPETRAWQMPGADAAPIGQGEFNPFG